ncbi:MAG: PEGA domain-containing protein [Phycisphaerae bacterium]|jgi:hypothetical protein
MKKRGSSTIRKYISQLLKKGYSRDAIKQNLINYGFDEDYVIEELDSIKTRKTLNYLASGIITVIVLASLFMSNPSFTGFAVVDNSYPAVIFASADYSSGIGLLYQGLGSDNKEHIYKDKTELPVQGKQKGSVNIIDYKNQGKAYYFTTGFYKDADGNEIASSDLYDASGNRVNTEIASIKNSASTWCDLDNNGFAEPIVIGIDNQGAKLFEVYKNENGAISKAYSFDGIDNGDVECFDMDRDGWKDVVVCGRDTNKKGVSTVYKNDKGILKKYQILEEVSAYEFACDIEVSDFSNRGKLDFIISGQNKNWQQVTYLYNSDSLYGTKILEDHQLLNPSISSADYNGDGAIDFVISGNEFANPKILFYKNINGEFATDNIDNAIPLKDGELLFFNDNELKLFSTGRDKDWISHAQTISGFPSISSPPSVPENLSYEKIDDTYLKFTWAQQAGVYPSYNIRAGNDDNANKYISGVMNNIETTPFKILRNPCLNEINSFFFQVQSINGAYTRSDWSDKFYINCKINATINQTVNITINETINITLPLTGSLEIRSTPKGAMAYINQEYQGNTPTTINELEPGQYEIRLEKEKYKTYLAAATVVAGKTEQIKAMLELNETLPTIWSYNYTYASGNINYTATYERYPSYVSVSESITNAANITMKEVKVWHDKRWGIIYLGPYDEKAVDRIEYSIGVMKPGQTIELNFLISKNAEYNKILVTQVDAIPDIKEEAVITLINLSDKITIEDNKTIIKFDVRANESSLSESGVKVRMEIPKCLIEKINELAIKSGRLKVSQKFKVEKEDPIISFDFANIIDPEQLNLEIASIAAENCTNQIKTEIIAKKVSAQHDEPDMLIAIIGAVAPLLGILAFIWGFNKLKKKKLGWIGYTFLTIISLLLISYELSDALGKLSPTLDFIKKYMSSVAILSFLIVINPAKLLFGHEKKARFFNFFLTAGYALLSVKNIVYFSSTTYTADQTFGDLALLILKNSQFLENTLFSTGIIFLFIAILIAWMSFEINADSYAEVVGKRKYIKDTKAEKAVYVLLLTTGFFVVFFTFLFDWFSVGVDSPFLILLFFLSLGALSKKALKKADENPEEAIKEFLDLFRHRKNRLIAFSFFPILIFIVESYSYLAYFIGGIKNLYLEAIPEHLLTIWEVSGSRLPYILQFGCMASMMLLSFLLWRHFFIRRENEENKGKFIEREHHFLVNAAFFFTIAGFISFILTPVISISSITDKRVSGVAMSLLSASAGSALVSWLILIVVAIVFMPLFISKKKWAEIIPYGLTVASVLGVTFMFIKSFFIMACKQILLLSGDFLFTPILNLAFLGFISTIYIVVIAMSCYYLLAEGYSLFWEDLGHLEWYRKIQHFLFRHKVKIPEEKIGQIEKRAKELIDQGTAAFVIDSLHNEFGITRKELEIITREILEEERIEGIEPPINHLVHPERITGLMNYIHAAYDRHNMAIDNVILTCRQAGYTQDEIAIASWRIKPKRGDEDLFKEMRKEL